jgi:hypothetical protein
MEWFATLSLALGSAWTSGINLYATVTVLGLLQKFGGVKLPGGLDVLDNWWIIGIAAGLYIVEFFADKIPYVDSVWDVVHTFIRVPAGAIVSNHAAVHVLAPDLPFGGVGNSGMGAYHGKWGFEVFSHRKAYLARAHRVDPKMVYPPYSPMTKRIMRKIF